MRRSLPLEPCALSAQDAADFVMMARSEWDRKWKAGEAPQPIRAPGRRTTCRWSRDELRAWFASGCPTLERWRPIWQRMLESGAWCTPPQYGGGDEDAA